MQLSTYYDECEMKIQKQNYLSFSPGLFCISISDKREGEGKSYLKFFIMRAQSCVRFFPPGFRSDFKAHSEEFRCWFFFKPKLSSHFLFMIPGSRTRTMVRSTLYQKTWSRYRWYTWYQGTMYQNTGTGSQSKATPERGCVEFALHMWEEDI